MSTIKNKTTHMPLFFIALAAVFMALVSFAPAGQNVPGPKTELGWLVGTWENTNGKGYYEKWEIVGDTLKGKNYKLKKGKEVLNQSMFFTTDGEHMYYHSTTIMKKEVTTKVLKFVKAKGNSFVFADKEAKYPEFATFQKTGAGSYTFEFKYEFGDMVATSTSMFKRVQ